MVAIECGVYERLSLMQTNVREPSADFLARAPLGRIPVLEASPTLVIGGSTVICQYLNELGGGRLLAAAGVARWSALAEEALADGIMESTLLVHYERSRHPSLQSAAWVEKHVGKVQRSLETLERRSEGSDLSLGAIAVGTALSYLDVRLPEVSWRRFRRLAARVEPLHGRASFKRTEFPALTPESHG